MAWMQPPVRRSAFTQVPPSDPAAGFQQVGPQGNGFSQVTDRNNPAARSYALSRLHAAVASGKLPAFLPQWNQDPAAAWRGVSALIGGGRPTAAAGAGGQYVPMGGAPPGVTAGANLVNPPYDTPSSIGPGGVGTGLDTLRRANQNPGRALQLGALLAKSNDWHGRVQEMAQSLSPGSTLHRLSQVSQFAHQSNSNVGPAEKAFGRLEHVHDVHRAASALATSLGHKRQPV